MGRVRWGDGFALILGSGQELDPRPILQKEPLLLYYLNSDLIFAYFSQLGPSFHAINGLPQGLSRTSRVVWRPTSGHK